MLRRPPHFFQVNDVLNDRHTRALIADELNNGEVMLYPTETVYGLGCNAFHEDAIRKTVLLKQRKENKPLILLVKDRTMLEGIAADIPPAAEKLIQHFWPGPLTIIFPAKARLSSLLTAGSGRIGIRHSPHPFIESLFTVYDYPLVSTSANRAHEAPALSLAGVPTSITDKVDLIIDGGKMKGIPSTVVDITKEGIKYMREGIIKKSIIERVLHDRD